MESKRIKRNGAEEAEALLFPILPEEIIWEILLRLPVKSQCRFRCVSKFWLHLLSSTEFTRDHIASLLRQTTIESPPPATQKLAVSTNTRKLFSFGWESILDATTKNEGVEYQLEDTGPSSNAFWENEDEEDEDEIIDRPIVIVGTSNGWVCVGRGKHLYLIEPAARKYHRVPPDNHISGFPFDLVEDFFGFGFAYDPASDDYKVVRIIFDVVAVYSIKSGSWRAMDYIFMQGSYNIDSAIKEPIHVSLL
ncbi:hypothetical protein Tsubulata_019030 [Turnera subulata]|uniref:F-box domain-containing protein n=1 Tax=Turnera subulata TaxID=218843 RepID=A0A9Q0G047_9ROSI|nr:hypothetical protein Tsubulata_019030 [Turnera subulata]